MGREAIFIGYRHSDTGDAAGRITDALKSKFGRARIFRDVENLRPGVKYVDCIEGVLRQCRVMLVLIGSDWLNAKDAEGRRRLDDPDDLTRIEIEVALTTPGVEVVPVLVNDAVMPPWKELPESLQPLRLRHIAKVRRGDFSHDMRLSKALQLCMRAKPESDDPPGYWTRLFAGEKKSQTVWVIRHARAISLPPGAGYRADIARPLADEGRTQAGSLRERWASQGVSFTAVGASPAVRALETAAILASCPVNQVTPIQSLIPPDSATGDEAYRINYLYEDIGDVPFDGYRKLPGDAQIMDDYGERCWRGVRRFLEASNEGNVLVVSHAVLSQATYFAAIRGNQPEQKGMRETLLREVLKQGGGFKIQFDNYIPQSVELLREPSA